MKSPFTARFSPRRRRKVKSHVRADEVPGHALTPVVHEAEVGLGLDMTVLGQRPPFPRWGLSGHLP